MLEGFGVLLFMFVGGFVCIHVRTRCPEVLSCAGVESMKYIDVMFSIDVSRTRSLQPPHESSTPKNNLRLRTIAIQSDRNSDQHRCGRSAVRSCKGGETV